MNEPGASLSASPALVHLSPGQRAWYRFRRNRGAVASSVYLAALLALILLWPVTLAVVRHWGASGAAFALAHDPNALTNDQFQPPSLTHWFGTDVHGRDLFSRTLYGAQISLMVGAVGTVVSLVIGVLWGAVAGYLGGRWDSVLMRIVDVLYSLPSIVFVIVMITTLEGLVKGWLAHLESAEWESWQGCCFYLWDWARCRGLPCRELSAGRCSH